MAGKPHEHPHLTGQLSLPGAQLPSEPTVATAAATSRAEDGAPHEVITGPNTRLRAGNAMHRAREGAVLGALAAIERRGLRGLTMVEAADRGGLARATLYNHVRDKQALLELVLDHETRRIARDFVEASTLEVALAGAADAVAEHPAVAGIRVHDPAAIASLVAVTDAHVRRLAADALAAHGCSAVDAAVDLVLRWLASFIAQPADAATRAAQAAGLVRALA